jgi:hypothetical protein
MRFAPRSAADPIPFMPKSVFRNPASVFRVFRIPYSVFQIPHSAFRNPHFLPGQRVRQLGQKKVRCSNRDV